MNNPAIIIIAIMTSAVRIDNFLCILFCYFLQFNYSTYQIFEEDCRIQN